MSTRARRAPWFRGATLQDEADRWGAAWAERAATHEIEAAFEEWRDGGNPVVDMRTAGSFFARATGQPNHRAPLPPDLIEHFRRWGPSNACLAEDILAAYRADRGPT